MLKNENSARILAGDAICNFTGVEVSSLPCEGFFASSDSFNFPSNACNTPCSFESSLYCVSWSRFLTVSSRDLCLAFKEATELQNSSSKTFIFASFICAETPFELLVAYTSS